MMIRFARPEDVDALLAIYAQYIDTPVTFECELPGREAFAARIREIGADYPYLVWEEGGRPVGYAYAHRQMERAAYQWNAELSVYLDREHTGQGAGRKLYTALMELLKLQGVKTVYGVVTTPNPTSEGLHQALGFRVMGTCRKTGYKAGAWRDVTWFERAIAPYEADPAPVRPLLSAPEAAVRAVLAAARAEG